LEELRKHTLNGNAEWTMLLLAKTDYAEISTFLDPSSWKGETPDNLKNVLAVVQYVFEEAPKERLHADRDGVVAAFRLLALQSLEKPKQWLDKPKINTKE
jgi:hypothetical protein